MFRCPCELTGLHDEESNEVCAQNWIQRMLTKNQKKSFCQSHSCYSNFRAFHTTKRIKPDVTVLDVKTRLPVLTVEVYSTTYKQTVKKALIEQYRILRAYGTSVDA